ncbi:MAG: LacI family DNA-binding transcriptional regulator [Cyclobacteriaceae bacterium]|nr:LacI family DNA-binding transcriptional regulator [Cyclobacteriaceae bacterium HetDA_MAG_MS6]
MLKKSSITIKDIAQRLGISTSTVSRALTGSTDISEKTREAVMELAKELDYQPNTIAQSLKKQKTNIIGIIIPETVNRFFSKAIGGIQEVASKRGYNVMACQSNESVDMEKNNLSTLINTRVDGIIVSVSRETKEYEHFKKLQRRGIPLVLFDRIVDDLDTSKIFVDNYQAAYDATKHLIDVGCKRIARITGPKSLHNYHWRLNGYMDALKDNSLSVDEDLIIFPHHENMSIKDYIGQLMGLTNRPDGIFTINDQDAVEIMYVLTHMGYDIPGDVAIVGFNNDFYSQFSNPPLTSVEIPAIDMGRSAAELLLDQMEGIDVPTEKRVLSTNLIIRESTRRD